MKTTIKIIALLLLTNTVIAQNKRIKKDKFLITNEITGKSVKVNTSASTLKDFGTLIEKKELDQTIESPDYFIEHTFTNIVFYESVKGKITAFRTRSKEISVEVKGRFSFSPGDHINKIIEFFPEAVMNARTRKWDIDKTDYLYVNLPMSWFNKKTNEDVPSIYSGIGLCFDAETKILIEFRYWITP